jgi:hypothetical protein
MTVIDLKKRQANSRATRDLVEIDKSSHAGRFQAKLIRDIEQDLAGRRNLSRIESELVGAFAGAAMTLRYLNHQILLGELSEIDLSGYATIASTMLRIGSKLGLSRRVTKGRTFGDVLVADYERQQIEDRERDQQRRKEFEAKQRPPAAPGAAEE